MEDATAQLQNDTKITLPLDMLRSDIVLLSVRIARKVIVILVRLSKVVRIFKIVRIFKYLFTIRGFEHQLIWNMENLFITLLDCNF